LKIENTRCAKTKHHSRAFAVDGDQFALLRFSRIAYRFAFSTGGLFDESPLGKNDRDRDFSARDHRLYLGYQNSFGDVTRLATRCCLGIAAQKAHRRREIVKQANDCHPV
jgi:hypothetical protein